MLELRLILSYALTLYTLIQVDIAMKSYGEVLKVSEIGPANNEPQLILGRIVPVNKVLTTPITRKSSVFYQVQLDHLEERHDQNSTSGEAEGDKVWVTIHGESHGCDFVLVDPTTPAVELYIPGVQVNIRVHITEDILNYRSIGLRIGADTSATISHEIRVSRTTAMLANVLELMLKSISYTYNHQSYLDGLHVKYLDSRGHLNKNLRLKEASFDCGEQVAVIGIVRELVDEDGITRKVMLPVRSI